MIAAMDNGTGATKLLFWILGLSIAILFGTVGLLVSDIREDIAVNRDSINALEHQFIMLRSDFREEQRLTQQIREWYLPKLSKLEEQMYQLQRMDRIPGILEDWR